MSERAKKAAEVLRQLGWQIDRPDDDGELDKECHQCGYQMRNDSRFCQNCGTKVVHGVAQSAIDDLEAAIVAALEESP